MNYGEKALEYRKKGYNCAQSVLCALAERVGLDVEDARNMSAGFGGGLRAGEACGTYCGAVLAISRAVCKGEEDGKPEAPLAEVIAQFAQEFKEKFEVIRCSDLMEANGGVKETCQQYIAWCADRAAEYIAEHENDEPYDSGKAQEEQEEKAE